MGVPTPDGGGATVTSTSVDPSPTLVPEPARATYAITFGGSGGRVVVVVVGPLAVLLQPARAAAAATSRTALVVLVGLEGPRDVMWRSEVIDDRSYHTPGGRGGAAGDFSEKPEDF
jgi:hypothetical protein